MHSSAHAAAFNASVVVTDPPAPTDEPDDEPDDEE